MTRPRGLIGLLMVGGGLLLTAWAGYHLMRTGTCASGGAYQIARPCPAGTGGHILGLMGGILLALAGCFVAARAPLGVIWFGMLFTLLGGAALLVALGPAKTPGSHTGGVVMGVIFVGLMGLPVVLLGLKLAGEFQESPKDDGGTGLPGGTTINL